MKFETEIQNVKKYDVIVVGSGPAGIAAGITAALAVKQGKRLRDIDVKDIQARLKA